MNWCFGRRGLACAHKFILHLHLRRARCFALHTGADNVLNIYMGANEATGAPSHRVALLARANTKPWIVPIGQNRRERRALPRGPCRLFFSDFGEFGAARKSSPFSTVLAVRRDSNLSDDLREQFDTIGR